MKLKDLLNINKGDVVSIVGAGGKTTLMFSLAEELRLEDKVLVTTTTKIYVPERKQYDYIAESKGEFNHYNKLNKKGIYIYGKAVNDEKKLIGLDFELLNKQLPYFDYVLIESDGSKKKPIKGWKDNEPVISSKTSKTIGVLSIENLLMEINEENVHNLEQFMNITGSSKYDIINMDHIMALIFSFKGLFKDAVGEKILFINKVDTDKDVVLAQELVDNVRENNDGYIDSIILGRLV
ncbi:selenium cofactor biosynthesis protein YqeC [Clostridium sp.]|jgi:probable selenium-dependent hydroxylase accessory protein YqeC|uniref:selenium cofactor biosynthesis protein YqeC n=1 Tax=Clostridium sp. TaxID=1506 RepID=UPI00258EFC23|nr:selenium cofactor biosynthesis protein YqeC [Clostridium sp.]MDF2505371.1 putative selenium-dependent hydroxylase accessory protein YqeC [Clostridium sp.]